jgi:SAM-dependent methyltransferase
MKIKNNCPICDSESIRTFLHREKVPIHQNLLIKDQVSAVRVAHGDLNIAICLQCGFIFNQTFDPSKLTYGEQYDNSQTFSTFFNKYLDELTQYLVLEKSVQKCRIVEVGCGSGLFLRKLVEFSDSGNLGYGFDPSYIGPESDLGGRVIFSRRYYRADCTDIKADVVVCRHVIEHISDPLNFLRTIRQALLNSTQPRVFFETPCAEWILRRQVFWDFFYEHCSYFTANSLTTAFTAAGFQVKTIRQVFEGQYLWLEATIPDSESVVTKDPGLVPHFAEKFALAESELVRTWEMRIKYLASKGKIALWGAGAKGVTFMNLIDPNRQWIICVVDMNPHKQGRFLPGTGHPIVSYDQLRSYDIKKIILVNPNYLKEIKSLLEINGLNMELVNLMN